jgi:hypothetical protein
MGRRELSEGAVIEITESWAAARGRCSARRRLSRPCRPGWRLRARAGVVHGSDPGRDGPRSTVSRAKCGPASTRCPAPPSGCRSGLAQPTSAVGPEHTDSKSRHEGVRARRRVSDHAFVPSMGQRAESCRFVAVALRTGVPVSCLPARRRPVTSTFRVGSAEVAPPSRVRSRGRSIYSEGHPASF